MGGTANSCSPLKLSMTRLVTSTFKRLPSDSSVAMSGAAAADLLEVIQHQQQLLVLQEDAQVLLQGLPAAFAQPKLERNGGQHQARVAHILQGDKQTP